jgi:fibro-slime domain-containing protein
MRSRALCAAPCHPRVTCARLPADGPLDIVDRHQILFKGIPMFERHCGLAKLLVLGGLAGGLCVAAHADTLTMNAQYFTVAESGDADFNTNPCCSSVYTNEVLGTLGPDGLPVYNTTYGGPTLYDVNANGELTWWSPSQNANVVATGSGTITLPFSSPSFFPPNGTGSDDFNGFQAAVFTATLVVPTDESVTFTFGADDDAFLALGNTVISQIGGIHAETPAPVTTSLLTAGSYNLELFYTDRHTTGAGLYFSVDTEGVTVAPPPVAAVPEPGTSALMLVGLGGIGLFMRRRQA